MITKFQGKYFNQSKILIFIIEIMHDGKISIVFYYNKASFSLTRNSSLILPRFEKADTKYNYWTKSFFWLYLNLHGK